MPPRRQNPPRQRVVRDIEMEELCQQIQRLQERLEAFEGQQAQHPQDEPHESEEDIDDENPFHHLRENESSSSIERVCHRRPQPNAAPKSTNLGIKIDIPDFEGRLQLDEFIDWLHTMERVFELKDIPDDKHVKLVAIKLKKHASIWWENLKRSQQRKGRSKIKTWEKMRRELTPLKVEKQISKKNITRASKLWDFGVSRRTQASKTVPRKVWCDVIPMDACHLLLGHPWQFDRKAIHDSHANTYSFVKDGVKVKLTPLKPEETLENKDEDKALISRSTFQKLHQESKIACLLLLSKINDANCPFPEEIRSLLEEFSDVVPNEIPLGLPPMRDIQHAIDFIPGSVIPNKLAYRMNPQEYAELQQQVKEPIEKGLVKESVSPCAVPVLLVPKKYGTWRMCVDSQAVNKITIKYRFPIPHLDDMLDQLHGATVFSKIDLRSGYHQIRMHPGDEWKTAFKTKDGLYEWTVMPFGLSNAPNTFMCLMNQNEHEHLNHLWQVFEVLREQKLYVNLKKCSFLTTSVTFLGYIITTQEFYAIVRASEHWSHYLLSKEFILHSDHEALKHLNSQQKISRQYAAWSEFLQAYPFLLKYKSGAQNRIADALSRRHALLTSLQMKVTGFEVIKELYKDDLDFSNIWQATFNQAFQQYHCQQD
ncbi:hypothetical protein SLEP1_g3923 [Rubroshorea leprosula]|uniref:Reverse transcriptase n=1 Tax=Rubroshorea leprosula TaxID=152421 RepID=A0AAV5HVV5_9ROSI|nr:hypothetical protein SLEP1_g3923 [Rubroshorea leprosula]